jgi:pimeloyl-ACP methyl ester carboxylesterase
LIVQGKEFDVVVRSHRLHVQRFGSPDAPLVLGLHGLSLNMKAFDYFGEGLGSDSMQLVAIDLRGRGRSEATHAGSYGWENHALDLFALADHFGYDRFSLVGQSMGGSIAMKAAEINGTRVKAIALVDVAGRVDRGFGAAVASLLDRSAERYVSPEAFIDSIKRTGLIAPWNAYWDRCYRYNLVDTARGWVSRTDPVALAEDRAYGQNQDPYDRWRHLAMPVLLLRAAREVTPGSGFAVPEDDRGLFVEQVPTASALDVGGNHLTINTHPDALKALQVFLGGT